MIKKQTNQTITTTHKKLVNINNDLNTYLNSLYEKNINLTEHDRKIIKQIRNKNMETLQLIDRMNYAGEVEL